MQSITSVVTFDELVEIGRSDKTANIVNGMPWSFHFNGYPITHETDTCYLVVTGNGTCKMNKDDLLVARTDVRGLQVYSPVA